MNLVETIFFYTRNDYLIINNLLCGNTDRLWEVAEIVNNDSKGVLEEYESGQRAPDEESVGRYRRRIYDVLDEATKDRIVKTARADIANILGAMVPAGRQLLLHRNVRIGDALARYSAGDIIASRIISSTSIVPFEADYDFLRYEIAVPPDGLVFQLDQFDPAIRNEDGEVLLPPMKCRVENTRDGGSEKCKGIIELTYLGAC